MLLNVTLGLAAALAVGWGARQAAARRRAAAERDAARAERDELQGVYDELREEYAARAQQQAEAAEALRAATADLASTRGQLTESRRLASLGRLTAGIAHEIKNPLNFVNNFAQLSVELADELREELEADPERTVADALGEVGEILDDIAHNARKITEHGQRADRIVRTMLMHARSNAGQRQPTDLNALVLDYADLAYHGMRAATPDFNATIEKDLDPDLGEVALVPQEIGRVVLNLLNNAFYAVHERAGEPGYAPNVTVATRDLGDAVELRVADNGPGIPEDVRSRIFEPFFTTKPTGEGTGLGLSLSHELVTKNHGGTMEVASEEGAGATFTLTLPRAEGTDGEATDG